MSARKKTMLVIGIILIFLVLLCIYLMSQLLKKPAIKSYISYMDNISDLKYYDADGELQSLPADNNKIIVFLSNSCGTCIEALPLLNKINQIYCVDQDINMIILWEDEIPLKDVKKNNLIQQSYSLCNVRIASALDTVFVVNRNNDVVFVDGTGEYSNLLTYISENIELNKDKMIQNANQYILDNIAGNAEYPQLIYFSMPGCPDCEDANSIIYSDAIADSFVITRIERDKNAQPEDIVDELNIFKNVYDIDWYPSFLVLMEDGSYSMIRKIDLSDLEEQILQFNLQDVS